jgi:isopenicillin-N N-acyltransferase-like protein
VQEGQAGSESIPEFLEIEVSGDGFERGVAHGEAVREYIPPYHGASLREKAEQSPQARGAIEQAMAYLDERFPDLVEELRGIAHGAKVDFRDIVLWNYRRVFDVCPAECTNFALRQTRVGPALCGTVDGWSGLEKPPREPYPVFIQRFNPREGYRLLASVLPGTLWIEKGLNEHGLAIGNSGMATTDIQPRGLPYHTMYRQALLSCRDVEEAVHFFERVSQICFGAIFVFVDASGNALSIEKSPTRQAVLRTAENWVGSANAFTTPNLQEVQVRPPERNEESARRRESMTAYAAKVGTSATLDDLLAFVRSHEPPAAICRHGGKDLSHTRESYVLLCRERRMLAGTRGYACKAEMHSFSL